MSREEFRKSIAFRYAKYKVDDVDRFEETVCEFNPKAGYNPREIYLDSLKTVKGECWLLGWLKVQYPYITWEQVLYDLIMHKSEKVYILYGVMEAGKSKVLDILKMIFGQFTKPMTIDQLSNRFNLGEVIGKLFIVGDDLGKENFGSVVGLIKSMATGETIALERKFMHSIDCKNEANFAFGTNQMPYLDINDDGVLRRFIILRFDKKMKLPCEDYQEFLRTYMTEVEAQKLLYQISKVKFDPKYMQKLTIESQVYMLTQSPVYQANTDVYDDYKTYCIKNGFKPYHKDNWDKVKKSIKDIVLTQPMIPLPESEQLELPF